MYKLSNGKGQQPRAYATSNPVSFLCVCTPAGTSSISWRSCKRCFGCDRERLKARSTSTPKLRGWHGCSERCLTSEASIITILCARKSGDYRRSNNRNTTTVFDRIPIDRRLSGFHCVNESIGIYISLCVVPALGGGKSLRADASGPTPNTQTQLVSKDNRNG